MQPGKLFKTAIPTISYALNIGLLALACHVSSAAAAELYRCTDPYDEVTYQNEPCKGGAGRKLPSADETLTSFTFTPYMSSDAVEASPSAANLDALFGGQPGPTPTTTTVPTTVRPAGQGGLTPEQRAALQKSLPDSVSLEKLDKMVASIQGGHTEELEEWLRHLVMILLYSMLVLILLSVPVALLAKRWGRSFMGWFVLSLTISPIFSFLLLLVRGKAPVPPDPQKEREALVKLLSQANQEANSNQPASPSGQGQVDGSASSSLLKGQNEQ